MSGRFLYGSADWVRMVGEEARRLLPTDKAEMRFSLVERFPGAPEACRPPAPFEPGYRLDVIDGEVRVRFGALPGEAADVDVTCDHAVGVELCAWPNGPELDAASARHAAAGRITIRGDTGLSPLPLDRLHDAVAARTGTPGDAPPA